jgi:phosphomannomutase
MKVNPGIFKAYDIRGIYPTDLNEAAAYAIGRAFVTFLAVDQVLVGRDMRLSGPQIFDAVTHGIMDQGADVINIGMVSTDQFYFACSEKQLPGMMVTASHNPKEYSGFKMVRQMPYLLSGAEGIQDLRRIVEADAYAPVTRMGNMSKLDLSEQFVEAVLGLIDVQAIADRGANIAPLSVVADTGNGMVGPILTRVFARLPVELVGLYLDPDGSLPNHGLDPLQPENRAELERRVISEHADAGFAFDGDGDRFFVIDDRGEFVAGDYLTALLGRYLLQRNP